MLTYWGCTDGNEPRLRFSKVERVSTPSDRAKMRSYEGLTVSGGPSSSWKDERGITETAGGG